MKKKSLFMKILVIAFPAVVIGLIYIFRNALMYLGTRLPACPIYTYTGIYCPGCGNTRSVQHLLEGDILGSLGFNIVPVLCIVLAALAYIELISFVFGKPTKIIPRRRTFWVGFFIVIIMYFIARNVI